MATDFLTNLLDRALERAPVLQRRRPSLFEPMPDTVALGVMPWGKSLGHGEEEPNSEMESWELQDAPALRPVVPTPRHTAAQAAMPMSESTGLDSIRPEAPIRPVAPIKNEARHESHQEAALPPLPAQAAPKSANALPPLPAQATPKSVRVVAPFVVETIVEKEVEKPWPAIHSAHPAEGKTITPVIVAPLSPPAVRSPVAPTSKRDQTGEIRATPREVSHKREMETISAKLLRPVGPSVFSPLPHQLLPVVRSPSMIVKETPPAPTIQVTIGRIEVRATSPSPATPKKAPLKPAAMSLEDYLRSRSGGAK